jgi:hypothetical protein
MIFRGFLIGFGLLLTVTCVSAKNYAFPVKNPVGTIVLPDNWKITSIDRGLEAKSSHDDVYFSIENANNKNIDKIMKEMVEWLKENKIEITKEGDEIERDFGGLAGFIMKNEAKDENGPTTITWIVVKKDGVGAIMTFWASEEEMAAHKDEVNKIVASIKAIQ